VRRKNEASFTLHHQYLENSVSNVVHLQSASPLLISALMPSVLPFFCRLAGTGRTGLHTANAIGQGSRGRRCRWGCLLLAIVTICLGELRAFAQQPMELIPVIITVAGNGTAGYAGDGGPATIAELNNPNVAVDSSGNLYIEDVSNERIRKVAAATGIITTVAGNGTAGYSGDGGPATSAELNGPGYLTVDASGNLYIADVGNNRIRKVAAATGIITTVVGNGTYGYSGDGGPATSAELNGTGGMAVDGLGNLYIADINNNRIREVAAATGIITTVAGDGFGSYSGDGSAATSAELYLPRAVALDATGNLYIADAQNNRIRKVAAATAIITTVAGNGTYGYSGDGGPATKAELNGPFGVALDASGNLYIADFGNNRIRKVAAATGIITTVAGNGTAGYSGDGGPATSAELIEPQGVAVDGAGNLYIADLANERIRKVSAVSTPLNETVVSFPVTAVGSRAIVQNLLLETTAAEMISSISVPASLGGSQEFAVGTITGCTVGASNASGTVCNVPITFAPAYPGLRQLPLRVVTSQGNVSVGLVGIGTGPQVALTPGIITTVAGNGLAGYTGGGSSAISAELNGPNGAAIDSTGNIYIADSGNNVIRMVAAGTGVISTVAGNAYGAGTNIGGNSGDGGLATSAELFSPSGVTVDSAGNLYIADFFNNRIREVSAATGMISTVAGNGTAGFSGDGGLATSAELNQPASVSVNRDGDLFVADSQNNRIRKVVGATGIITTVIGNGNPGFSGDGGTATAAEIYRPTGVALDSSGNLFVADLSNNRIRKVSAGTGIITTVAGSGTPGFSGDGGEATNAELWGPSGLALDSSDNLYIADALNERVREVAAETGVIRTVSGNGQIGNGGDGGAATSAELWLPSGVVLDSAGSIYVADFSNNVIREVNVNNSPPLTFAPTEIGSISSDSPQTVKIGNIGNQPLIFSSTGTGDNPSYPLNFPLNAKDSALCASGISLNPGNDCDVSVNFIPNAGGNNSGSVWITDNSLNEAGARQGVPLSGLGIAPAAIPAFSVASGTYTTWLTVSISDTTPSATIYYSTDGSIPTASSTVYSGPLTVMASETIKAIAIAAGSPQSAIAVATYTLVLPATATPVISLAPGVYSGAQTVTLSDTTSGATIYYTTDGAYPVSFSANGITMQNGAAIYSVPITVSTSETLTVAAAAPGFSLSLPASDEYFISSSATSMIYTIAGSTWNAGNSGDGGSATGAFLNSRLKAIRDSAGNLLIADAANNRIRKVDAATGVITTVAGTGSAGFSGDGGAATSAQLNYPISVAADKVGNVYIADANNNRIRKISAQTGVITTYAGTGIAGNSGDGSAASTASLYDPVGIAFDGSGNLYISDSNRVREVNALTGIISTVAGNGYWGYSGDGGPATSASISGPSGITVDNAGNLYFVDQWNYVIRKVTASNGVITTVAGNSANINYGDGGLATSAALGILLQDVAVDSAGNLYIVSESEAGVRKVTASNGVITTVAGSGATWGCGWGGDGGPAISAGFCDPTSISIDGMGNLYVSDQTDRVREITASGVLSTTPTAVPVFSVVGGTYASTQTVSITDETPGASIYVTLDGTTPNPSSQGYRGPIKVTGSVKVQAIAIAPGYLQSAPTSAAYVITSLPASVITTVAGNGVSGFDGIGGAATSAEMGYLVGLTLDNAGNMYFTDSVNNVVWMVSATTGVITVVAGDGTQGYSGDGGSGINAQLSYPRGVVVDGAGNLYIADSSNHVVRRVAANTGMITTFAGNGQSGYQGDGGPATAAELTSPQGLAFDTAGNLYVADNGVVRMISASTGVITTEVGNLQACCTDSGDGGLALNAGISPQALAFDRAGNLYISSNNSRVRKVTMFTGIITTVAGNGDSGYSGDGGSAINAEIAPQGLALDATGNLYLSESGVVRMVSPTTGVILPVVGNGYGSHSGDGGSAAIAGIVGSAGIAFDTAGDLYIADAGLPSIRKVAPPSQTATPAISVASGTYTGIQTVAITDSTAGAVIYFTTDGSTPTTSSTVYSGPIIVSSTETIEAIAQASNHSSSAVASAVYIINLPAAATPTFSVTPGTYASGQTVTVSDATNGAVIYYTTNGATPTGSSTLYSGPITISSTETIKAIATASGYSFSAVATVAYTIMTTPSVTVTPAASSITTAQTLTVTVMVSGGIGNPATTGSVTLTSGTYTSGVATLSSGSATVSIPAGSLAVGTNTLTVTYSGDTNYNATTGTASVTVTTAVNPSFAVTGKAVTVTAGSTTANTSIITVTPTGGFTGSVVLTASITSSPSGAQDPPTVSFGSTTPISISGTTAGTATLTISTTAPTTAAFVHTKHPGIPWYAAGGATLACILLFGIPVRRRRWQTLLGALMLLITFTGGVIACGGSGGGPSNGSGGGTSNPGTTAGAYTVTVTGTSGATTATGTVTLTVQ